MTDRQYQVFKAVLAHESGTGEWYRAATSGQRVTLASLYRAGALQRRVWRVGRNPADNAHEYRLAPAMVDRLDALLKAKLAKSEGDSNG